MERGRKQGVGKGGGGKEEGGREAGFPLPRVLPEILNFAGSTILNCKLIFFTLKS